MVRVLLVELVVDADFTVLNLLMLMQALRLRLVLLSIFLVVTSDSRHLRTG